MNDKPLSGRDQMPMAEPPLTESFLAPEILVDGFAGGMVAGPNGKLLFFSLMTDATGAVERRAAVRMTANLATWEAMHAALGGFLEEVRQQQAAMARSDV